MKALPRPMSWKQWMAWMVVNDWPAFVCEAEAPSSGNPVPVSAPAFASSHADVSTWKSGCAKGFVRDSRFGSGQVIKGTNRSKSRANRRMVDWSGAK